MQSLLGEIDIIPEWFVPEREVHPSLGKCVAQRAYAARARKKSNKENIVELRNKQQRLIEALSDSERKNGYLKLKQSVMADLVTCHDVFEMDRRTGYKGREQLIHNGIAAERTASGTVQVPVEWHNMWKEYMQEVSRITLEAELDPSKPHDATAQATLQRYWPLLAAFLTLSPEEMSQLLSLNLQEFQRTSKVSEEQHWEEAVCGLHLTPEQRDRALIAREIMLSLLPNAADSPPQPLPPPAYPAPPQDPTPAPPQHTSQPQSNQSNWARLCEPVLSELHQLRADPLLPPKAATSQSKHTCSVLPSSSAFMLPPVIHSSTSTAFMLPPAIDPPSSTFFTLPPAINPPSSTGFNLAPAAEPRPCPQPFTLLTATEPVPTIFSASFINQTTHNSSASVPSSRSTSSDFTTPLLTSSTSQPIEWQRQNLQTHMETGHRMHALQQPDTPPYSSSTSQRLELHTRILQTHMETERRAHDMEEPDTPAYYSSTSQPVELNTHILHTHMETERQAHALEDQLRQYNNHVLLFGLYFFFVVLTPMQLARLQVAAYPLVLTVVPLLHAIAKLAGEL